MTLQDAFARHARARHSAALRPHLRFAVLTPANTNCAAAKGAVPPRSRIAQGGSHDPEAAHPVPLINHVGAYAEKVNLFHEL